VLRFTVSPFFYLLHHHVLTGEGLMEDETIEAARIRAAEVVRCVHTLIA
jgi:hypothetical protein